MKLEGGGTYIQNVGNLSNPFHAFFFLLFQLGICGKEVSLMADRQWNENQTICKDLLDQLKRRHLDPLFQQLQGRGAAKVSFDDIIGGYQRIKDEYYESAIGAKDVIAKVFLELHAVRHS